MVGVSIKNETRSVVGRPRSVFSDIAKSVLPKWEISLVFVGAKKARTLNKQLRGKDYIPNVLSYVVGEKSGEIIICPDEAVRQATASQLPASSFQLLLFIHGVLHIKGWAHSATMEKCEHNLLAHYEATYSHRHRHRHAPNKN